MPEPDRPFPALPIVEPADGPIDTDVEEEDFDDEPDGPRTILLTGACTALGRSLRAAWGGLYEVIALDRDPPADDPDAIAADLMIWDGDWADLFEEVDLVVHLGDPPGAEPLGPGFDRAANVFLAAAVAGVERLIFAAPHPSPGDSTSIAAGRLGKAIAFAFGLEFIDLEIAATDREADAETLARFLDAIEGSGEPADDPSP